MHNTSNDDLKWIYFIAKNNKEFTYNKFTNSIDIEFYSAESYNRLIIKDYSDYPLYTKSKRNGRLSAIKYEGDAVYKLFLYFYKEYTIYIQVDIKNIVFNKNFNITFIRNIYKHYYIFI
jgi:hypothetical protein